MPCSRRGPVALWERIGGERLLYGALPDKSQKLLVTLKEVKESRKQQGESPPVESRGSELNPLAF